MHVAIIVPAYNVAPFVRDTISSVLDQTYGAWSLVVVDDGSTDETAALVAGFTDQRINLIRQGNAGVSAARNTGIAAGLWAGARPWEPGIGYDPSQPRWPIEGGESPPCRAGARLGGSKPSRRADAFLFLDGDDWLMPTAIGRLVAALDNAPWATGACGRYARLGLDGAISLGPPPPSGCLLERLLTRNLFANGGHLLIRREAIETAGPFRDDLSYGEDWEYWTRLALLGEFTAVRGRAPVLFVRERLGGASGLRATDPLANRPALNAIYRNPGLLDRLGRLELAALRVRSEAESAWATGRALIRHGQAQSGRRWLAESFRRNPSVRRLVLLSLSWLGIRNFRPYRWVG